MAVSDCGKPGAAVLPVRQPISKDISESNVILNKNIDIPYDEIAAFCERHHIRKLSLFGSVLRDDYTPDSDVDVLVEFEPEHIPGLKFFAMQRELSDLLGLKVDLNTYGFLSRHFRDKVVAMAEVIYEREG